MYADEEVDYEYTPPSPDLGSREQSAAPAQGLPKYLEYLWIREGQTRLGGGVHARCQASDTGCDLTSDQMPGFAASRSGTPDPGKFRDLLAQLPSRLRGESKSDFAAGVAFAVTLWESCNPVIVDMAEWPSIRQDQRRFGGMRAFVPVSPLRDETKFEYVAIWANRRLARISLDATTWSHNYAKFQERVVNFARERQGLKVASLPRPSERSLSRPLLSPMCPLEPPPNYAPRGDTRGRAGPSAARQSARRHRDPRSRSRSTEPEAKRSRREAGRSPSRDRPRYALDEHLYQLRDEVAELTRQLGHSEQEFEGRLQDLQDELQTEREKRRDLQSRFEKMSQLCEQHAATAEGLKNWARETDVQRLDFYKKCSELERLIERLAQERDRVDAHLQALYSKIQQDYVPFEELKKG
ncbi:hypothetical protein AC1031_014841 [Aphanomyces cochlioides]|nr:hypothetical protein AC1031_014841 [Aphanomyces cochlioides]